MDNLVEQIKRLLISDLSRRKLMHNSCNKLQPPITQVLIMRSQTLITSKSSFMRSKLCCSQKFILIFGLSVASLYQSACSRVRVAVEPKVAQNFEELDQKASHTKMPKNIHQAEPWWYSLDDAQLNQTIDGVFTKNLQLKQATEHIAQMRSIAIEQAHKVASSSLDLGWSMLSNSIPLLV